MKYIKQHFYIPLTILLAITPLHATSPITEVSADVPSNLLRSLEQRISQFTPGQRAVLFQLLMQQHKILEDVAQHTRSNIPAIKIATTDLPEGHTTHETRTLYMASAQAFRGFLPTIFRHNKQGLFFMLVSAIISSIAGLATYGALKKATAKRTPKLGPAEVSLITLVTIIFGTGTYLTTYLNSTKEEDEIVLDFIKSQWPQLRSEMTWPDNIREILDYLNRKAEASTLDLEEAKRCLTALHQRSAFD